MVPFLDAHIAHTTVDHGDADSLVTMAERILHNAPAMFDMAGHSMGGRVALEVMRLAPERVRRLALLGTGYRAKESGAVGAEEVRKRQVFLDLARTQGVRAMAAEWVKPMVAHARALGLRTGGLRHAQQSCTRYQQFPDDHPHLR